MNIISKQLAGVLMVGGLVLILALNLFLIQPISFSLILIGVLLLTVVFLYNPAWGIFLFLLARPALDSFSETASIRLTEQISLNAAAGMGLLAIFLAGVFFVKNYSQIKRIPLKKFWFFYLAVVAVSIIFSIEKIISFYELLRLLSILSVFSLAFAVSRIEKSFRTIFYAVLASAIIPLSAGFYQFLTQSGISRTVGLESRIFGTFSHPNSFAAFLLIIFALSLYFFFYYQNNKEKNEQEKNKYVQYSLIALFIFFLLLATFSRGAWLALLIFGLILGILKKPQILAYIAVGILVAIIAFEPIRDRVEDLYNPPITGSVYWRLEQWTNMYALFQERPFTGYGAGTETLVHERAFGFYAGNPYTHNDFLKNALEVGIFGAISYGLLLLAVIWKLFFNFKNTAKKNTKTLFLVLLALFAAEIAFGMSSNILRSTAVQWPLWALIGSALAIPLIESKKTKDK
ncbi:MAG: O-antigen ligase family protein [Candidatus Moranbacteria bacterium]|nr:O-antigen ligase family protein [Candidatus Moranbacteria bacterium]